MSIFFLANNVPTVWLHRFAEVGVGGDLIGVWLAVDTSGGVPGVFTLYVLDAVNEIGSSISLTLSEIFAVSEHIVCNCLMILNRLLYNDCLWEVLFKTLIMESHGSAIQNFFLTVSEDVLRWFEFPLVVSRLLLSRCIVAVCLLVHLMHLLVIADKGSAHRVQHFFGVLKALAGHTKRMSSILDSFRPLVAPTEPFTQWLSFMRCILIFFNIVEFVGETGKVLSLDYTCDMLRRVSRLSITVVVGKWFRIFGESPMLLNLTWFIHMRLSVLLKSIWRTWLIGRQVHILPDVKVSVFSFANTHNCVTGC